MRYDFSFFTWEFFLFLFARCKNIDLIDDDYVKSLGTFIIHIIYFLVLEKEIVNSFGYFVRLKSVENREYINSSQIFSTKRLI